MAMAPPTGADRLETLKIEASSPDPQVRAQVIAQVRTLLQEDFDVTFDATQNWVLDRDELRREVALRALTVRGEDVDDVRTRRLIGRAELFIGGSSRPLARLACREIIPYLLGLHPRLVAEWVRDWLSNSDEQVRCDVALVLAALAGRFPTEAVDSLASIAVDPRPNVRAGFTTALRDLIARHPAMAEYVRARFPGRT